MKQYYYDSQAFYDECHRRAQRLKAFRAMVAAHATSAPTPNPAPTPVLPFPRPEKRPLAA